MLSKKHFTNTEGLDHVFIIALTETENSSQKELVHVVRKNFLLRGRNLEQNLAQGEQLSATTGKRR